MKIRCGKMGKGSGRKKNDEGRVWVGGIDGED